MNRISKIAITVLFFISTMSDTCLAAGKDDFILFDTSYFIDVCGLKGKGFGYTAILTKEYANSSEGQDLIMRFINCQQAYENGKPADAPGKPEGILEALRKHSVGQTIWGAVKSHFTHCRLAASPCQGNEPL